MWKKLGIFVNSVYFHLREFNNYTTNNAGSKSYTDAYPT